MEWKTLGNQQHAASPRLPVLGVDVLDKVQHKPLQLLHVLAGRAARGKPQGNKSGNKQSVEVG